MHYLPFITVFLFTTFTISPLNAIDLSIISKSAIKVAALRAARNGSADEFEELRKRLAELGGNVGTYSGKVQNGISKMDIQKNNLNNDATNAVLQEKQLTEQRHQLESQLTNTRNAIASVNQQINQLNQQEAAENENVRKAQNEIHHLKGQKPKRLCIWKCRKNWKKAQKRRIEAAEAVLRAAEERRNNAVAARNGKHNELNSLNQQVANLEAAVRTNQAQKDEWRQKLLKSTSLTEMVLQLVKDLSTLQINVNHLRGELNGRKDLADEDLGFGWEAVEESLKRIENYLKNGGFVKDLAGWGIDIAGFDAESIRKLGVDIDQSTRALLGI